jgi:hypothetical protein
MALRTNGPRQQSEVRRGFWDFKTALCPRPLSAEKIVEAALLKLAETEPLRTESVSCAGSGFLSN